MPHARRSFIVSALAVIAAVPFIAPARAQNADRVVLRTNADEAVVAPLVAEFEKRTGIDVAVEAATDTGSVAGADVVWFDEPFSMIRLAEAGALAPLNSETAGDRPKQNIGSGSLWHGFAGRARGFILNAADGQGPPQDEFSPDQWQSRHAAAPQFSYGMFVLAEPESSPITAGHFASLYTLWGEYEFQKWCYQNRRQQMRILPSEDEVVRTVGMREALGGLASADDAYAAQAKGWPVEFIAVPNDTLDLENQRVLATGPIVLPNAVGVAKGAPHAGNAAKLADFLLSADAERMLARSAWKTIPVREDVAAEFPDLAVEDAVKFDYEEAAANTDKALAIFRRAFPR